MLVLIILLCLAPVSPVDMFEMWHTNFKPNDFRIKCSIMSLTGPQNISVQKKPRRSFDKFDMYMKEG